ncbi:MAG TPA: phage tail protein [Myxococcales bacterium]|jgi:phage tail-like protein|nr:phage tail protein [Myxococcales bacterium]
MPSLGLNAAFSLITNLLGVRLDPYQSFNFLVEVEGILVGGFSEVSGLGVETETFDYREGGLNEFVHRFSSGTKYQPLVLKHGITLIDGLWGWHQEIVSGTVTRRNGTIYLLNQQHIPVMWWDFTNAFPTRWTGPDLRAGSAQVAIESLELSHQGLSKPALTALIGAGLAAAGSLF